MTLGLTGINLKKNIAYPVSDMDKIGFELKGNKILKNSS